MQLHNKNKVAYYSALTVLFSYAEFLLPRLPFLKLGLGNIIVLLSLSFPAADFLLLLILKSIVSSFISGTLFSPFFLISFFQSVISGFVMYILNITNIKVFKEKFFSVYGISLAGAGVSAFVQIILAGLYLGRQIYNIFGLMLIFSLLSGTLTAFLSKKIHINKLPELSFQESNEEKADISAKLSTFLVFLLIIITFCISSIEVLLLCFIISIIFQLLHQRKFLISPHLSLFFFIIFLSLFTNGGKILYKFGILTIYEDSFFSAIKKSLILSTLICISQCAASLKLKTNSITGLTASYFYALLNEFYTEKGSFIGKINKVLQSKSLKPADRVKKKDNYKNLFFIHSGLFLVLLCADFYLRKIV